MYCFNHDDVAAVERCSACAEAFCNECLVTVSGIQYCESCKCLATEEPPLYPINLTFNSNAKSAAICAFAGLVIFTIPLAIAAMISAKKALDEIKANPRMTGWGVAVGAACVSAIGLLMGVVNLLYKGL